jgi:DNA-binding MarR family transcriptional regulator
MGIEDIIREECKKTGVKEMELMKGSRRRKVSMTRAAIALRCKEEVGCSGAEIARHLGVNTTSINRAVERAERSS